MMTRWWPGCGKRSKVLCGKRRCPPTRRSSLSPTWCQATTRSGSHLVPTHSSDHRKLSVFLRSSNETLSRPPSLTVTDSDGATSSTQATLAVYKAKDYRPVANAGPSPVRLFPIQIAHSDLRCHKKLNGVRLVCVQVIQLPQNSVTLYGNQSTDDHDNLSYEWSLSPESKDKVVEMQVGCGPLFKGAALL